MRAVTERDVTGSKQAVQIHGPIIPVVVPGPPTGPRSSPAALQVTTPLGYVSVLETAAFYFRIAQGHKLHNGSQLPPSAGLTPRALRPASAAHLDGSFKCHSASFRGC